MYFEVWNLYWGIKKGVQRLKFAYYPDKQSGKRIEVGFERLQVYAIEYSAQVECGKDESHIVRSWQD